MIQEISKTIKLLFQTLRLGNKVIVEEVKPYAKLYIKVLLLLAFIATLSPIPFLIIGIILDLRWLIALAGIWWAFWTFLLLLMASPIGILIESLTGGIKGSGQRYIRWVSGILLTGLCISLFASFIPIKENLSKLQLLIGAAIILGLLNVWFFRLKVISFLVSIIFIVLILSFYFPTTFKILGEKISDIDILLAEPKRLYPTYESIQKNEFKFFRPDGKPKVWYYRTREGRFELFDKKSSHPIYKEELKPMTPDVISQVIKQLKEDAERKAQEEQRKREEAERLEKQKKENAERKAQEEQRKREKAERLEKQKKEEAERIAKQKQVNLGREHTIIITPQIRPVQIHGVPREAVARPVIPASSPRIENSSSSTRLSTYSRDSYSGGSRSYSGSSGSSGAGKSGSSGGSGGSSSRSGSVSRPSGGSSGGSSGRSSGGLSGRRSSGGSSGRSSGGLSGGSSGRRSSGGSSGRRSSGGSSGSSSGRRRR